MASLQFLNKADATQDLSLVSILSGTVAVDTTTKFSGIASYKVTSTASVDASFLEGVVRDAGTRIVRRFRFDTLPAAQAAIMGVVNAGITAVPWALYLNPDGSLFNGPGGATGVTGTKKLSVNTWYQISVAYVITNSTAQQLHPLLPVQAVRSLPLLLPQVPARPRLPHLQVVLLLVVQVLPPLLARRQRISLRLLRVQPVPPVPARPLHFLMRGIMYRAGNVNLKKSCEKNSSLAVGGILKEPKINSGLLKNQNSIKRANNLNNSRLLKHR